MASFAAFAVLCATAPFLSGCPKSNATDTPSPDATATPVALTPDEKKDPILPSPASASADVPKSGEQQVSVYHVVPSSGDKRAHLEKESVPLASGGNAAMVALNQMADGKESPLPKGTHVQAVDVASGTATVNFNQAFADNFAGEGGDDREALIFNAITATLGQFKGVKQVQILVDGKKVSLGGTQDTTEPMPIPETGGTKVALKP